MQTIRTRTRPNPTISLKIIISNIRKKVETDIIEIIENIINKVPSITYISSIGSSKSLLFNLPSYIYPNRKFIVIVPRISLVEDLNS